MIDSTPLGELTAKVMDRIEQFGDSRDGEYIVRTAAVVVELDSAREGCLLTVCSDDRPWVMRAFLDEAIQTLDDERDAIRPIDHDTEDEDR